MARRTTTPAEVWLVTVYMIYHKYFGFFIARCHSSYCGDGWLVLLEPGFKGHSPSVATKVGTFKHLTLSYERCFSLTFMLIDCGSLGLLVLYLLLTDGMFGMPKSTSPWGQKAW